MPSARRGRNIGDACMLIGDAGVGGGFVFGILIVGGWRSFIFFPEIIRGMFGEIFLRREDLAYALGKIFHR